MSSAVTETSDTNLAALQGHYVLCGAGRTGLDIIDRFCELGSTFVVVETNDEALESVKDHAAGYGSTLHYVKGDATEDEALLLAGIERAAGLVAALSADKDNLFAILTARSLNPGLRIVTRVNDAQNNREKLEKAGADRVISTDIIGGMRIASELIRPEVVRFLDQMMRVTEKEKTIRFTELSLDKIKVPALAELLEKSRQDGEPHLQIKDIGKHTGLLVVAIKSPEEEESDHSDADDLFHLRKRYRFTPRGDAELDPTDILVVIGTQDKLDEVTNL
jgi:Trk K+ transport system NAD-binding subunit